MIDDIFSVVFNGIGERLFTMNIGLIKKFVTFAMLKFSNLVDCE